MKRVDPEPYLDRLAMALLTESSGGLIFANDGRDFAPGSKRCFEKDGTPWPEEKRLHVIEVLRRSLAFPHDREDSDGYSTGPLQQISREAVTAGGLGSWGWGSIADTMNPARSAEMFIEGLRITDVPVWVRDGVRVTLPDPIAADVLRVQNPGLASGQSSNYSAEQIALAKRIARGGSRFFTDGGK